MKPLDEVRPDLVGDGHDIERLLTAKQVAEILQVPEKAPYDLTIPRIKVSDGRVRWRPADIRAWIAQRVEDS